MSKDSGPAFPAQVEVPRLAGSPRRFEYLPGMTLRDYFAAAALNGYLSGYFEQAMGEMITESKEMAACFYRLADAMLAERNK